MAIYVRATTMEPFGNLCGFSNRRREQCFLPVVINEADKRGCLLPSIADPIGAMIAIMNGVGWANVGKSGL